MLRTINKKYMFHFFHTLVSPMNKEQPNKPQKQQQKTELMLSACFVNCSSNRLQGPEQSFRILFQSRLLWEHEAYTKITDKQKYMINSQSCVKNSFSLCTYCGTAIVATPREIPDAERVQTSSVALL